MGSPFLQDTAVEGLSPGRYKAELPDRWNLRPLPQGGVVTAVALRAMTEELGDREQKLRTMHTTFVAQVAHGLLEVEVETLRRGRSMSHLRADVRNPGTGHGHVTTAVFGRSRQGFDFVDLDPPTDIPPPDDCPSFRTPPPEEIAAAWVPMPFWEQVEGRSVLGHAPWDRYEPERAERVMWYHFDEPPMLADGTLDPCALVVLADSMPGAVAEKLGQVERVWFAPSVDLTVHLLEDCRSSWVLAHNRARHAGDGYASADMALWDCGEDGRSTPRLVAYGTQVFLFTFLG